ncbi:tRNA 5-methoxyuridine(34)/uridine 5-oxyacetic acid(34) synthase CmoB [Mariprofundus sp. KV]|uniref:tRNA 5-methoxyuridine(34)/uridine 5-oxyacetic acid(34) synthase CmoB n=1 Tax=Mariprofundus sp. KV TaxID=2608715 RepID=UPI0015A1CA24|nr:tRNA 5-methoxyuridine(34)/uridine 5-oxyacetic acid(34) synthase CmoB [Mariprofundus sp. KV]NWF35883.1 tRNA 5-methoxyuridine(34)/uridine 5-oxyacetic acid(34) synthase CmoB [Mariprofundus sp. KV]
MRAYRDAEGVKLQEQLTHSSLAAFSQTLMALHEKGWHKILKHGDLGRWQGGFDALPDVTPSVVDLHASAVKIGCAADTDMSHSAIETALKQMHPWRKGPFEMFGVYIDTEWHSDWKWDRLKQHIAPLAGRTILDVGCGSGYHLWRMLADDAKLVIGIDPTPLFSMHFATIKRYVADAPAFILPVGIEDIPEKMHCFDTVFSMGILYHRKSPIDHLLELKGLLNDGGELVLDTLVIEGDESQCLMPHGRYAKMRNVWFIPSVAMLKLWLKRAGYKTVQVIDISPTTVEEQRPTAWMQFESLPHFLDPHDSSLTIEGYPAPIRAVVTAKK